MVRKYRVTVAGQTYEVEVEELGSGGASVRSAQRLAPQASAAAPSSAYAAPAAAASRPAPAAAAQAAAEHAARPAAKGGVVSSPLPGKVLAVRAQVGQEVKRGDLLLVIEAMKMENEIFAGEAGTVRKVHVSVGQSVETGDPLAEIASGG
jgi:glutaconyl-CoA decarboxylase